MHLFPPFLEDHHYRLQAKRERGGEREILLSRAAQQFSCNTMNLDGQISKGVLSCSDRQAACCKHVQANAWSCARFHFSSLLNQPGSVLLAYLYIHKLTDALFIVYPSTAISRCKNLSCKKYQICCNVPTSLSVWLNCWLVHIILPHYPVTTFKIFFCKGPVWACLSLIAEETAI